MPYFLYSSVVGEPLPIPQLGYCEESCNKHGFAGISFAYWFILFWIYAQEWYGMLI
jgi:hypothetical protein